MEAFASVSDLLKTWPGKEMGDDERAAAAAMLDSATAQLTLMLRDRGFDPAEADEIDAEVLKGAVCAMVKDAMDTPPAGIASMQQNIGSTTASVSWSNPNGAFYLSGYWKRQIRLLCGGSGKYREVRARTYADEVV